MVTKERLYKRLRRSKYLSNTSELSLTNESAKYKVGDILILKDKTNIQEYYIYLYIMGFHFNDYIAKRSDFTIPNENSNHPYVFENIEDINFEYKKSIKLTLRDL